MKYKQTIIFALIFTAVVILLGGLIAKLSIWLNIGLVPFTIGCSLVIMTAVALMAYSSWQDYLDGKSSQNVSPPPRHYNCRCDTRPIKS